MLRPLLASLLALPLAAHDFWIQPSTHRARPGELVKVRLMVGEGGKGEGLKRNPDRFLRFAARSTAGEVQLAGLDGSDPAGFLRPAQEGLLALVYAGKPSRVELPAAKFEAYLREEGLDRVAALRRASGQSGAPGRERFIRSAKALVQVGEGKGGWDQSCALPLEFLPEADPFALHPGDDLPLRLLLDGKPLADQLVVAVAEDGVSWRVRTDAEGRCRITLRRGGRWILKAVHMAPVSGDPSVDWESLWASLTFQI